MDIAGYFWMEPATQKPTDNPAVKTPQQFLQIASRVSIFFQRSLKGNRVLKDFLGKSLDFSFNLVNCMKRVACIVL